MKKVLHIFNEYLPKTEQWAYQLMSHTPNVAQHVAAKVYLEQRPDNGQFSFMDNPISDLEAEDQTTDWKKNIFKKVQIRVSKKLNKSFEELLRTYIEENQIDLVHAHFANVGYEVCKALEGKKIRIAVSYYGWDYEMLPHVKPEWVEKYKEMFDQVDMILTEGNHGLKTLNDKGCKEQKLIVQKLGIERRLINYKSRKKTTGKLKLIQIASFTEKKGQLYTVKAFAKALQTCPNLELTLIGDSREASYKSEVMDYISDNHLQDRIVLKDFLPYDQLDAELSKYHVFIHPSCYAANMNCEGGAPTIIFNAAGGGMPCISTTHCDIPSLIVHEQTGLLCKEKDVDGIANNINQFYKMDEAAYQVYAKAAHQHIADNYCIEDNASRLSNIYSKLLEPVQ